MLIRAIELTAQRNQPTQKSLAGRSNLKLVGALLMTKLNIFKYYFVCCGLCV